MHLIVFFAPPPSNVVSLIIIIIIIIIIIMRLLVKMKSWKDKTRTLVARLVQGDQVENS
jgi:preprotein translocase subunit YajC